MTRLISNSTRSRRAASTDGGTGAAGLAGVVSVLAALLTWLPGRAGPRLPAGAKPSTGRWTRPVQPVSYRFLTPVGHVPGRRDARFPTRGPAPEKSARKSTRTTGRRSGNGTRTPAPPSGRLLA